MTYKNSKYIKQNITTTGSEVKILEYTDYKNYYSKFYINSIMFTNTTTSNASLDIYFTRQERKAITKGDLQVLVNAKGKDGLDSTTVSYYILKGVVIPAGSSLVLEQDDIHLQTPFDLAIVTTQNIDVCIEVIDSVNPIHLQNDLYSRKNKTTYKK